MYRRFEPESVETTVPVTVTKADGSTLRGRIVLPLNCTLDELLNGNRTFLEFQVYGGEKSYVAKAEIRAIEPSHVPRPSDVNVRLSGHGETVDPYAVLGVARGSAQAEIKRAYHKLAKLYHPDRYASADLPEEVSIYLAGKARQVNAAFAALREAHEARA